MVLLCRVPALGYDYEMSLCCMSAVRIVRWYECKSKEIGSA